MGNHSWENGFTMPTINNFLPPGRYPQKPLFDAFADDADPVKLLLDVTVAVALLALGLVLGIIVFTSINIPTTLPLPVHP